MNRLTQKHELFLTFHAHIHRERPGVLKRLMRFISNNITLSK